MTRHALLALALAVGVVACAIAATARADTFAVLQSAPSLTSANNFLRETAVRLQSTRC